MPRPRQRVIVLDVPLFDFHCEACGASFEALVVRGEQPTCESCGNRILRKLPSQLSLGKSKAKKSSKNDGGHGDHIGNRAAAARAKGKTHSCC